MANTKKQNYNSYFTNKGEFNQKEFSKLTENKNVRYDFIRTTFRDIHFTDKDVIGRMSECRFWNCRFDNFDGIEIESNNSIFHNCTFNSSDFSNSHFMSAQFYHCNFNNTNLKNSNIEFAKIGHTTFDKGTELSNVRFYGSSFNNNYIHNCIINEPVQGLSRDNITMDGATAQECEIHRSQIFDELKIEPISFEQIAEQSRESLEPLPVIEQNSTEINGKQIRFKILPADPVTEYLYNVQVHFKYEFTDEFVYSGIGRFCQNIDEVNKYINKIETEYSKNGYSFSYEGREELIQKQHRDKLQAIAEYEQKLNVSPEECIVEINYATAHWQPRDSISPEQAEAVYDHITDNQRIGFERANEIRQGVGQLPLTADEYYSNIKYMAFVNRFDFGDENSIDIEAINKALEEVPTEYVLWRMTEEQQNLFAEFYKANIDNAETAPVNISPADKQLYDSIIDSRNNLSFSNNLSAQIRKQAQFKVISEFNPAPNEYQTWIRKAEDIKTFEETLKDSDWEGWEQNGFDESYSATDAEYALKSGKIKVYSSHPIKQGVFVTPSYIEARSYSGDGKVYSKEVDLDNVAWIDPTQGQFAVINDLKPMYSGELAVYFDGEDVYVADKYNRQMRVHPSENYSYNTFEEYLNGISEIYPEYRLYIEEHIAELSNNYENALQAASDEAISVEHDRLSAAISQGGFGENTADSNAYKKLQHLDNQMSLFDKSSESNIEPGEVQISDQPENKTIEIKSLTKEEFDKLTSEIKDIAKTYQSDPDLLADYFAFKAQFYQYSPTNTMLIHLQNPYATFVASFTKWKQMGYSIKKGQHHIKISRPIETTKFPKTVNGKTTWTDVKYATPEEKAKIANGELEIKKVTKFIPHQVFDISQTNCPVEDYPKFYNMGHPDLEQQQLYECVKKYATECGFTVTEEDLSSISLHGYYDKSDDSIHINSLLEDSERLRTMCHELAHGVLHKTSTQPVEIKEFEAECFSAMLKRKMGFPVSEESKRYIKQYFNKSNYLSNGKFDMSKTLNRLSKTFNHITTGIDKTISDMGFSRDREISHTLSQANSNAVDIAKISKNFMQALS